MNTPSTKRSRHIVNVQTLNFFCVENLVSTVDLPYKKIQLATKISQNLLLCDRLGSSSGVYG